MAIVRERNDLDKKWTWYLFLLANVCVLIGCATTWIMVYRQNANLTLLWLPTVICNLVAIGVVIGFMLLEAKEIMPKSMHFQKKWLYWYLAGLITFVCSIIFSTVYYVLQIDGKDIHVLRDQQWIMIVYFVITGVLTLVAIGLQRYARFRIDLDVYRRKQGQLPKVGDKPKTEKKPGKRKPTTDKKASGGLLEEMDKK